MFLAGGANTGQAEYETIMKDKECRRNVGVVVSCVTAGNGKVQLVFDDVHRHHKEGERYWTHAQLFTATYFDRESYESLQLSREDFETIGQNVVARLMSWK